MKFTSAVVIAALAGSSIALPVVQQERSTLATRNLDTLALGTVFKRQEITPPRVNPHGRPKAAGGQATSKVTTTDPTDLTEEEEQIMDALKKKDGNKINTADSNELTEEEQKIMDDLKKKYGDDAFKDEIDNEMDKEFPDHKDLLDEQPDEDVLDRADDTLSEPDEDVDLMKDLTEKHGNEPSDFDIDPAKLDKDLEDVGKGLEDGLSGLAGHL